MDCNYDINGNFSCCKITDQLFNLHQQQKKLIMMTPIIASKISPTMIPIMTSTKVSTIASTMTPTMIPIKASTIPPTIAPTIPSTMPSTMVPTMPPTIHLSDKSICNLCN